MCGLEKGRAKDETQWMCIRPYIHTYKAARKSRRGVCCVMGFASPLHSLAWLGLTWLDLALPPRRHRGEQVSLPSGRSRHGGMSKHYDSNNNAMDVTSCTSPPRLESISNQIYAWNTTAQGSASVSTIRRRISPL